MRALRGHYESRMETLIETNKVYNCDCIELLRDMLARGRKADWCITDPPYGIGIESMSFTNGKEIAGNAKAKRRNYSDTKPWDKQRITKEYFDLIFKCSKNQIIFGGNYYADYLPPTASWIVWDKRCDDKMRNDFADCEIAWCSKGVARVFHYVYNGMIQGDMKAKDERFHPTQKPTQLWVNLINYYTKPGDLILDPFMGSFTTAIAAYRTGRNYIGAELDKDYYELGSKRLEKEKQQLRIFDL